MNGRTSSFVETDKAIRIFKNTPPTANANGPYFVQPGSSIPLSSAGSTDPDLPEDTLTFQWDLDADGVFGETGAAGLRGDETGPSPTIVAVSLAAGA